jgi:uncharacterized delta-60 repeat protein
MTDTLTTTSRHNVVRRLVGPTVVALIPLVVLVAPASSAGDGALDPTFSGDGKVITDFGSIDMARAVALQGDGRIVVAGVGAGFLVARYHADGTLDGTFSGDGKQTTDFGNGTNGAYAVGLQADGKVVAAGYAFPAASSDREFALVRYLADGSLDPTFSGDGQVTTDFGANEYGQGMAIQPDGKIVVAGITTVAGAGTDGDFALARYQTNGSLDPTFSGDGKQTTDFGAAEGANAIALQPDGKIVVAGYSGSSFAVARYDSSGTLDPTFSGDGKVTTGFANPAAGYALVIQPDGGIVVAGQEGGSFALARYTAGGVLDPTFSGDGLATTEIVPGGVSAAYGLARQADGALVAVGAAAEPLSSPDFAVARFRSDGSLDPTFAGDGTVVTDFGGFDRAYAGAVQPDGMILAAGGAYEGAVGDFGLARYRGPDGIVTIGVPGTKIRLHHRRATLALACPASEVSPPCAGEIVVKTARKVRYGRHHRKVVLVRKSFSITAGTTTTLRMHLSKRKAALLRHLRRARRVVVTVQVHDAAGNQATVVKRMKVVLR